MEPMIQAHTGEFVALATAMCWTVSALSFQRATGRAGSLPVNILRMFFALIIYLLVSRMINGKFLPLDAPRHVWIWMSLSGLVGFVFGDFFLFKSYEYISARISMLIMSLSPPIAAFFSWLMLGETMSGQALVAMTVTLTGIVMVVVDKRENDPDAIRNRRMQIKYSPRGIFYAFLGAIGQGGGLVISKYGMAGYPVFGATQIRIIAASFVFGVFVLSARKLHIFRKALYSRKTMLFILAGATFGPFIGVFLSLLSVKHTSVGIASTIMAIVPVLIIPPAIILLKEKVSWMEVAGSFVAVSGVGIFFM